MQMLTTKQNKPGAPYGNVNMEMERTSHKFIPDYASGDLFKFACSLR